MMARTNIMDIGLPISIGRKYTTNGVLLQAFFPDFVGLFLRAAVIVRLLLK